MIWWPLYPFSLALFVVADIYTGNMDEVWWTETIKPILLWVGGTGLVWLLLRWKWKEWAAPMTALAVFVMIMPYLWSYARASYFILEVMWFCLAVYLLSRKSQVSALVKATPYLNFVCLTLLLPSFGTLVLHTEYLNKHDVNHEAVSLTSDNKPDIYYIIIDRYSRSDVMESIFGLDNTDFLEALRSRGFYIADQTYANYNSTATSLYSSLNMEYVPTLPSYSAVYDGLQKTSVLASLEENGYTLVWMGSWWKPTARSASADWNFNKLAPVDFAAVVWEQTLVGRTKQLWGRVTGKPVDIWQNTNYKWEKIEEVARMPDPTFVFAHFLTCHSPYAFNADGSPNYRKGEPPGAYQDGVTYTNTALLEMVDGLSPDAIVIIQADHGPYPDVPPNEWSGEEYKQQYAILNAMRIPGAPLYPSISPVNTFRVLFNTVFHTDLALLPDRRMQWAPGHPGVEVLT